MPQLWRYRALHIPECHRKCGTLQNLRALPLGALNHWRTQLHRNVPRVPRVPRPKDVLGWREGWREGWEFILRPGGRSKEHPSVRGVEGSAFWGGICSRVPARNCQGSTRAARSVQDRPCSPKSAVVCTDPFGLSRILLAARMLLAFTVSTKGLNVQGLSKRTLLGWRGTLPCRQKVPVSVQTPCSHGPWAMAHGGSVQLLAPH